MGMDPLEVVGSRAHQVPWLVSMPRYATGDKICEKGLVCKITKIYIEIKF